MDIVAAPELIIERTIVMAAAILTFGTISIGGLWLWRRFAMQSPVDSPPNLAETMQRLQVAAERLEGPSPFTDVNLADAIRRLEALRGAPADQTRQQTFGEHVPQQTER